MKKVIIMGKGVLAVKIADWFYRSPLYELIYVVPSMSEPAWTLSLKNWAKDKNVAIIKSGHFKDIPDINRLKEGDIDLVVSVTYNKIFKDWFIKKCAKIINIHNGPLPQYRGVNPINWALKNKEQKHGVTIHEISPGIDDGPIINYVLFPINPTVDEVIDVYERCLNFGWKLFKETMPRIFEIKSVPQNESNAKYYSKKDFINLKERSYFTREESIKRLNLNN